MTLSPPLSSNGAGYLFQHGLHHLVEHNRSAPYPAEFEEKSQAHSQYNSPTPTEEGSSYSYSCPSQQQHQQQQRYYPQQTHQQQGLGSSQEGGYNHDHQGRDYQDRYNTPAGSPLPQHMDTLRTRSGLGIPRGDYHQPLRPRPEGRSPSDKPAPKAKKVKKEKVKAEKKVAKLEQPLSFLTKDWKHVPVVDIDAYVNRSAEVRRQEVEDGKIPGKVKRPMNSFMLYRKAYQNRTKDWCLQNNHQVVSQVCGDSWPLEPDHIKDQFSEWARIERINHQNAHPGYKFSPTKPGTAKANKRKMSEEVLSEESELDDFEWQGGGSKNNKRRKTPRPIEQSPAPVSYPSNRDPYQQYDSREPSMEPHGGHGGYHRSSWIYNNPGRQAPPQYREPQNGAYFQQTIRTFEPIHGAQDVILKETSTPVGSHSFLGLPGVVGQDYERHDHDFGSAPYPQYARSPYPYDEFQYEQSQYDQYQYHHSHPQHRIDPSLMESEQHQFDEGRFAEYNANGLHIPGHNDNWHHPVYDVPSQNRQEPILPFLEAEHNPEHIHDPHVNVLGDYREGWQVEAGESLGAIEGEFDKWVEEDHHA